MKTNDFVTIKALKHGTEFLALVGEYSFIDVCNDGIIASVYLPVDVSCAGDWTEVELVNMWVEEAYINFCLAQGYND